MLLILMETTKQHFAFLTIIDIDALFVVVDFSSMDGKSKTEHRSQGRGTRSSSFDSGNSIE
jgi:hypothetical protein